MTRQASNFLIVVDLLESESGNMTLEKLIERMGLDKSDVNLDCGLQPSPIAGKFGIFCNDTGRAKMAERQATDSRISHISDDYGTPRFMVHLNMQGMKDLTLQQVAAELGVDIGMLDKEYGAVSMDNGALTVVICGPAGKAQLEQKKVTDKRIVNFFLDGPVATFNSAENSKEDAGSCRGCSGQNPVHAAQRAKVHQGR